MVTSIAAMKEVFNVIVKSDFKQTSGLSGAIYMANRPLNSSKEDVVVSALVLGSASLQEGVINVNLHVPSLTLHSDATQPNIDRLAAIAEKLVIVIHDVWGNRYNFKVEDTGSLVPDGKQWFYNIRVRYWTLRDAA